MCRQTRCINVMLEYSHESADEKSEHMKRACCVNAVNWLKNVNGLKKLLKETSRVWASLGRKTNGGGA